VTMTEVVLMAALVVLVCLAGGLVMQVRAIARETRGMVAHVGTEGEQTREHLTNGLNGLIELQTAEMAALRAWMEDRPRAAIATIKEAEAVAPKPHACRFVFDPLKGLGSEERTNKMIRQIWVCTNRPYGCRNVHEHNEPEG
jgi:hypothetical protein